MANVPTPKADQIKALRESRVEAQAKRTTSARKPKPAPAKRKGAKAS
jgi:hypothetical protein